HQPEGQREGRGVRLRARAVSGHPVQGAVAEAARPDRRDPCLHPRERVATEDEGVTRRVSPMTRIPGAGVALAALEWAGRGPAVVAIHGLTANHRCWASVADALAPDVRLIAYDLRGRGESDKPPTGYSLAIHGDDLAALLDHFGLRRVVLIGHS